MAEWSFTMYIMYLNLIICFYITVFLLFQSMAVGNPAKVVGYTEKEDPSLTMKHGKHVQRFLQS
jgi:hypothetical protein